jgi:hypothetical protein
MSFHAVVFSSTYKSRVAVLQALTTYAGANETIAFLSLSKAALPEILLPSFSNQI